jgi:thiosulfate dehydrogenase [quinone] large subunit
MRDHRDIAHALLRFTVGVMFLLYGVEKLRGGIFAFTHGMVHSFEGILPAVLVKAFAYALPFAEVLIGVLLILGLFTRGALTLAGLLMVALTFGTAIKPEPDTVAQNVMIALVIFVLLWTSQHNGWSIDRRRKR